MLYKNLDQKFQVYKTNVNFFKNEKNTQELSDESDLITRKKIRYPFNLDRKIHTKHVEKRQTSMSLKY